MAVEGYIGWASNVNKIILSQSTFNMGEGATKTEELGGGSKKSILSGSFCPDKFSITMEFQADEKVKYKKPDGTTVQLNKTEFQLFQEWYKYKHKYGTVPFEFPKIYYSPQSGIKHQDDEYGNTQVEYYKITSAIEGSKVASWVQVKMTWESVYGGVVSVTPSAPVVNGISEATDEYIDISFSEVAEVNPTSALFKVYIDGTEVSKTGFYWDNEYKARIYFSKVSGSHEVTFSMSDYNGLTVAKNTYKAEING